MTFAVYLPLLLSLLLSPLASRIATSTPPAWGARLLTAAATVVAVASTCCLTLLAMTLFDDVPPLSTKDDLPGMPKPVPGTVALAAALILLVAMGRLVGRTCRQRQTHRELHAAGRPAHGLLVADWDAPYAVAVPGRPGHILLTTGMLRLLDTDERRVLFAHERSHLAHRHHRLVGCAALAAAVNPLLRPVHDIVAFLVERWADEDAAAAVGDRDLVARSVAKAALAAGEHRTPALAMNGASALRRVQALNAVPPRRAAADLVPRAAGALLTLASGVALVTAVREFVALARIWLG